VIVQAAVLQCDPLGPKAISRAIPKAISKAFSRAISKTDF
jgi:hypothetical protein